MRIDILTIFPKMFTGPFEESILRRAQDRSLVEIKVHNLRDWAEDKHKVTDDRPYGGGPGMVMKVEPIEKAVQVLKHKASSTKSQTNPKTKNIKLKTVLMSAKGKLFTQQKAREYSELDQLILVAGHYEGVDERVVEHVVDEEIRIGDYVLTGGELPAMVVVDSVVRLIPGVLGNDESNKQESHSQPGHFSHPQYTRPEEYKGWKVPEVLLNGNHAEIEKWRQSGSKILEETKS